MDRREALKLLKTADYGGSRFLDTVEAALDSGDGLMEAMEARLALERGEMDGWARVEREHAEEDALELAHLLELREERTHLNARGYRRASKSRQLWDNEAFRERALRLFAGPRAGCTGGSVCRAGKARQMLCRGQIRQRGATWVQTVAPRSMSAWFQS